jgi:hypothetical protein
MRLWSLHPKYLDPQGLVALWREALLAQAVLMGKTRGYHAHPQLHRFREQRVPHGAIGAYLREVHVEAAARGYSFDREKIARRASRHKPIAVMQGQVDYEWDHLMRKLKERNPQLHRKWRRLDEPPVVHPLFAVCEGGVEAWERVQE